MHGRHRVHRGDDDDERAGAVGAAGRAAPRLLHRPHLLHVPAALLQVAGGDRLGHATAALPTMLPAEGAFSQPQRCDVDPVLLQAARLAEYSAEHTDGTFKLVLLLGCVTALACMPLEPVLLLWGRCAQEAVLRLLKIWVTLAADNVVHYLMIQRTSAVTTTVLGEIKIIGLLLLSSLLLGAAPCVAC